MTTIPSLLRVIGRPIPQANGPDKVRGQTRYAADFILPDMLHGRVLRSTHPHARIRRIDVRRAEALPGVRTILTAADIPPGLIGRRMYDMPVLARDRVRFVGERVAVVAAEDPDTAEEALSLIEVDYEDLPAVFDPIAAMRPGAPLIHDNPSAYKGAYLPIPPIANVCSQLESVHGDMQQGLAESDFIFEHSFSLAATHQGYIEPQACLVQLRPDGIVEVWSTNKTPFEIAVQLAEAIGVSEGRISVHVTHIGGDFGGKGAMMDIPLCYYIAKHCGRPAKMVMTYTEELIASNIRHPGVITLRTGVKRDGRLWAQDATLIFNSGAYAAFKPMPHVNIGGVQRVGGSYRIPHVYGKSLMVYTNTVPGGFMRGPGSPQMIFAVESQVDMIARELGFDPLDLRRLNAVREGDTTPLGEPLEKVHSLETLQAAADAAGWGTPKGRNVGRGFAFHDRKTGVGIGSARIVLEVPGRVRIETGVADAGPGVYNVQQQVVAEVLGLEVGQVEIKPTTTDALPPDSGLGASRMTHVTGQATLQAAEQLRDRLLEIAGSILDVYPQDVEAVPGGYYRRGEAASMREPLSFERVSAEALSREGGPIAITTTYSGGRNTRTISSFCAQVAEVEVDDQTGQVALRRFTTAIDTGTIINPILFQGQIDGSIVQGMGYTLSEELQFDGGAIQNANLGDYKMPSIADVPALDSVLLVAPAGPTPFEGKMIGELPNVPVSAAIANAIADAVGVRIDSLPITAEKVYRALHPEALTGTGAPIL